LAKLTNEMIAGAVQPFMEPGEQIIYCAYGIQQPSWGLIIPLIIFAVLPGLITQALLTKYFMAVLTNRRLLLVNCSSSRKPREILEYRPGAMPLIAVTQGPVFAAMRIADPRGAMKIKFHRAAVANNREQAVAIGNAIAGARPA